MRKGCFVCGTILAFFGLVLLVLLPVANWILYPMIERTVILKYLDLKPENAEIWNAWIEPSSEVPIYFDYNMWSLENAEGVIERGEAPSFVEIGPYSYSEVRRKDNIQTVAGETIRYGSYLAYNYDQDHTNALGCQYIDVNGVGNNCDVMEDKITVLNIVMALFSGILKTGEINLPASITDLLELPPQIILPASVINDTIDLISGDQLCCPTIGQNCEIPCDDSLFIEMPVNDILYGEHEYNTLIALKTAFKNCACLFECSEDDSSSECVACQDICNVLGAASLVLPTSIPGLGNVLGNGTKGSWYAQNTGRYVSELFGQISEYNGMTELPPNWWPSVGQTPSATAAGDKGVCKIIAGTDGTQINPLFDTELDQWLFVGELRRSIYISPVGDYDFDGIDTTEFTATETVFDITAPENFCFCPDALTGASDDNGCLADNGDDTYNATGCKIWCRTGMIRVADAYGIPGVVMSSPHFLYGDADIYNENAPAGAWSGIVPDEGKHRTVLRVEKKTGLAVDAAKRIQFNFAQLRDENVAPLNLDFLETDGYGTIIPFFWVDENSKLTPASTDELKGILNLPANLVLGLTITFGFIGGLAMIGAGSFFIWRA